MSLFFTQPTAIKHLPYKQWHSRHPPHEFTVIIVFPELYTHRSDFLWCFFFSLDNIQDTLRSIWIKIELMVYLLQMFTLCNLCLWECYHHPPFYPTPKPKVMLNAILSFISNFQQGQRSYCVSPISSICHNGPLPMSFSLVKALDTHGFLIRFPLVQPDHY